MGAAADVGGVCGVVALWFELAGVCVVVAVGVAIDEGGHMTNPFLRAARDGEDPRQCGHLGLDPWDGPPCSECEAYGEAWLAVREEQQEEADELARACAWAIEAEDV